jgi:hypothetical protein
LPFINNASNSKNNALNLLLALFRFTALPTFFDATTAIFNCCAFLKKVIKE